MYTSMMFCILVFILFFFKQKTAYEMRISDWSSDVCSSDLFELSERLEVPARVVISEYVDLTSAFYDGREIAFVNGLLDRLAHVLRAEEFGGPADLSKLR